MVLLHTTIFVMFWTRSVDQQDWISAFAPLSCTKKVTLVQASFMESY